MATSAAIFLNMILLFWAFRLAPISVCVAIFYSGPIISLLLQHLLKQRKMSRVESAILAAASLTIVTMIVFATPGVPGSNHVLGYALAFGGGILFGLIPLLQIGTRSLPNSVTLLIQSAFAALCLLPFSLGIFSVTAMKSVFELAILGILFTLVPFCLWWQALRENAKLNPFVSYLDPMTAILISVFVFKEYPGWVEATGAFVLGGCALIAMSAQKSNRSEEGVDSSSAP
jgi:drug/metabolite transporter (DMT)-like permease